MVQIQSAPGTRWMCDDPEIRADIKLLVESMLHVNTAGTLPKVIVSQERCVCEICDAKAKATVFPIRDVVNWCRCCGVRRVHQPGVKCVDCTNSNLAAHCNQPDGDLQ